MQIPMDLIARLEDAWGVRPAIFVACIGGADQHIQVWHPDAWLGGSGVPYQDPMPSYVVALDGAISEHPDADPRYL